MVVQFLSDTEALKVAMNLEEQGLKFYRDMARSVHTSQGKKAFSGLAEDEKEHFETFSKLHNELSGELSEEGWRLDEDVRQYLASLIETGVFYDASHLPKIAARDMTEKDAVRVGIQAEKDSILFYTEAGQNSINRSGRKAFLRILDEEKRHLAMLTERLKVGGGESRDDHSRGRG